MDFLENKNVTIGIAVFLILIFIVGVFVYFKLINSKRENPLSFKNPLGKIPFFNDKTKKAAIQKEEDLIAKEKEDIKLEWNYIEQAKQELKQQEKDLEKKQQEILIQESEIQVTGEKLNTKLSNLKSTAQYYELMDAKKAAEIMSEMEDEFILQLFQYMKKENISQILTQLEPKKAANITKKMVGVQ